MNTKTIFLLSALVAIFISSCKKEEDSVRILDENYNPVIAPANFVAGVTNPYFPLTPGKVYKYEEGLETNEVSILNETRVVAGVTCVVVHDVVKKEGVLVEDTYDWYAQDVDGNVWYFGEDVSSYENGVFANHDGSWETGVDGAKPGIIMMANPVQELPYRQEYYFDNTEDWGKVVAKDLTVTTPYGTFTNCIKTEDWNAIEPGIIERKYYAPGTGFVKEETATGGFVELVEIL